MNKIKQIEYAFEIERESYLRTIEMLRDELGSTHCDDGLKERYELAKDKVNELLVENENLMVELEQARGEVARLEKELDTCGKKLNATQYKEYKRLKRKEYQQRWLKKKAQQLK